VVRVSTFRNINFRALIAYIPLFNTSPSNTLGTSQARSLSLRSLSLVLLLLTIILRDSPKCRFSLPAWLKRCVCITCDKIRILVLRCCQARRVCLPQRSPLIPTYLYLPLSFFSNSIYFFLFLFFYLLHLFLLKTIIIIFFYSVILTLSFSIFSI
jgi:hypothetical protein